MVLASNQLERYPMKRSFRERAFIVLWCLYGLWTVGVFVFLTTQLNAIEAGARARIQRHVCAPNPLIGAPQRQIDVTEYRSMTENRILTADSTRDVAAAAQQETLIERFLRQAKPPTGDRVTRILQAYERGELTPDESAVLEEKVRNGRIAVPPSFRRLSHVAEQAVRDARRVSQVLLDAYTSGMMNEEDKLAFDRYVSRSTQCVPLGFSWGQALLDEQRNEAKQQSAAMIGIPLLVLIFAQYLVLGFIDPVSLFRKKRQLPIISLR